MSLLSIVNDAQREIGVSVTGNVVGSSNSDAQMLLGLAHAAVRFIAREHAWQALVKERTFVTVAQETQTGAIPADFDRIVNDTAFNRTRKWRLNGPLTAEEWQSAKMAGVGPVVPWFRIRGNDLLFIAAPGAGETVAFEYVTTNWIVSASGLVYRNRWAADDDSALVPEELVTFRVIERYLSRKGLDTADVARQFAEALRERIAADGGRRMLTCAESAPTRPIPALVQEGSWPLS